MSLKKFLAGILIGIFVGAAVAVISSPWLKEYKPRATREIASEKWERSPKRHAGKLSAPVFVQLFNSKDSRPESGYYKLVAHVSFNEPVNGARFQWAMPEEARIISGLPEGDVIIEEGAEDWERVIEIQLTDLRRQQNILFDFSFEQNGRPMSSSDIFVFRPQVF